MSSITHEAEVQRQHTRYRLPLKSEISGRLYDVPDWSLGGVAIEGDLSSLAKGKSVDMKLIFPFEAFAMNVGMQAEVVYLDAEKSRAGLRFVNITRQQSNILRFVIDAYVSGEVVSVADILEVSARRSEAKTRATPLVEKLSGARRVRHIGGLALRYSALTAASLVLLGFIGLSVKERLFTIPANSAVVTTDMVIIPAPAGGSVGFLTEEDQLKRGDPIAAIESIDGKTLIVNSPCDCLIQRRYASAGDFVTFGTPVIALRRADARPYVAAYVPNDRALEIMGGGRAIVVLADGARVDNGELQFVPADERPDGSQLTKIIVSIDEQLASPRVGEPARVFFETPVLGAFQQRLPNSLFALFSAGDKQMITPIVAADPVTSVSPKL